MTIDDFRPHHCSPSFLSGVLDVDVVRVGLGTVVMVAGELDRAAVPPLATCLQEILDLADPGETVVLDLAGTDFVDVGGMRFLVQATARATARGMRLRLAGCSAQLLRLLHLTDLVDGLEIVPPQQR
jgi:anti-anti-sigma factor